MNDKYLADMWKAHFEANMLDGDKVEDCGRAMLSAESVWEYLATALAKQDRESRLDEYEYIKIHKRQKHPVPNSVGFTECIPTGPLIERIKGLRAELTRLTKEPAPEEEKR